MGANKGRSSCKRVDVEVAKKSLATSQEATNSTNKFNLEQQQRIAELQKELEEVSHACLPQAMPESLIDLLNQ